MKIEKERMIQVIKEGMTKVKKYATEVYDRRLDEVGQEAFSEAIEMGITNTVAALYDAKVKDEEILRVVSIHWGVNMQEAEERLIYEKSEAVIRALKQYLRLQGNTEEDIDTYIKANAVSIRVRYEKELWKYKDAPQKLMDELQKDVNK